MSRSHFILIYLKIYHYQIRLCPDPRPSRLAEPEIPLLPLRLPPAGPRVRLPDVRRGAARPQPGLPPLGGEGDVGLPRAHRAQRGLPAAADAGREGGHQGGRVPGVRARVHATEVPGKGLPGVDGQRAEGGQLGVGMRVLIFVGRCFRGFMKYIPKDTVVQDIVIILIVV